MRKFKKKIYSTYTIFYSLILILTIGCSKNDSPPEQGDPIGLISFEEFNSVSPPSYQAFIDASEKVVTALPQLMNDKELFARAVFDEIVENSRTNNKMTFSRSLKFTDFFDILSDMNREEFKVLLLNMIDAYNSRYTVGDSKRISVESYPCDNDIDFDGGKADALRHALWSALMTKRANIEFSEAMGTAHESESKDKKSTTMDLANNEFGRNLALKFPEATEQELLELLLEQYYTFAEDEQAISDASETLVFIKGKRDFDLIMNGTFSNPDSGGPWNIQIVFNQCDNVIRGRFTIIRGQALQERRFSGNILDGNMNLDVSNPFVFENPDGLQPCINVNMILQGNTSSLNGNWTSSNCRLGGVVQIN